MREYYDPETEEEVTVVTSIQVARWKEFDEFGTEYFEPKFSLEGGKFPKEQYAIPKEVAIEVEAETMVDVEEHGITVVDTDNLKRL